ncbi:MAG: lytic murein transglycosylase, partial [Pseudomonadota bacterium]|nr:lytic murein transglycosylase [Pseudomonadota bacterium]
MSLKKQYFTLMPALVMVGCTSQQAMQKKPVRQGGVEITQTQTVQVKPTPAPVIKPQPAPKPSYSSFSDWKSDFSMRAISSGYDAGVIRRLLDSAYLNQQVISLDSGQPEFS